MRVYWLAVGMLLLALPGYAQQMSSQLMSKDKLPESSSCRTPSLYEHGVNMRVTVAPDAEIQKVFETTISQDISRFKDTGVVQTGSDLSLPNGIVQMNFDVHIVAATVRVGDKIAGYTAMYSIMEECADFPGTDAFGVSALIISSMFVDADRDHIMTTLGKSIYDSVISAVQTRRSRWLKR